MPTPRKHTKGTATRPPLPPLSPTTRLALPPSHRDPRTATISDKNLTRAEPSVTTTSSSAINGKNLVAYGRESLDRLVPQRLEDLVRPHVESFDWFLREGISDSVASLDPVEIVDSSRGASLMFWLENLVVAKPLKEYAADAADDRLFPVECREAGLSYHGHLLGDVFFKYKRTPAEDGVVDSLASRRLGTVPIMVKSSACHLRHVTQRQLVAKKEEATEVGGYFICNGIEKMIRLLVVTRRNYPLALKRSAFLKRGPTYTDMATSIRCARPDQSTATVRLHYLTDGNVNLSFTLRRQEFFIPVGVVLKCFMEASDREIYERLVAGGGSHFVAQRAELLLSEVKRYHLTTRADCLAFIGNQFRQLLELPASLSDAAAGQKLLDDNLLVHLYKAHDKFFLLLLMLQKLYALVDGAACEDNADTLQHQELLLPGHLLNMFLKERLQEWLQRMRAVVDKDIKDGRIVNFGDVEYVKKVVERNPVDIGRRMDHFMATGNLVSQSGLDLMQAAGFTVVAERLNHLRYISHFRSVHRGAYFATLRTTTVRKLLPESWGFMCPVHTPDGAPCGLLNHLTKNCTVVTTVRDPLSVSAAIARCLVQSGLLPLTPGGLITPPPPAYLPVVLDGCIIGSLRAPAVAPAVAALRRRKTTAGSGIPADLEVAHIPPVASGPFPGLFLFTTPARMMRPVEQLAADQSPGQVELIGTLEQGYMDIRCPDGVDGGGAASWSHTEIHPTAVLSVVSNLTPWSDYNQSPRNMYQCQMGKQTMGIPFHAFGHKGDSKVYRLQSPQSPIARTTTYADYSMDDYPTGTNAVVAVLAYTGYDMEDAMILNKSSMERGLCHASIYKTEKLNLNDLRAKGEKISLSFGRANDRSRAASTTSEYAHATTVDVDGLPYVGQTLEPGDPFLAAVSKVTGVPRLTKLKGSEAAVVDKVTLVGNTAGEELQNVNVLLRFNRNPLIGDKFSSRHGQKGVLSQLWPDIDMPWVGATGMRPDIIINPHAFPSRMTIGMLIESMAAKAGALSGHFVDATPFKAATAAGGRRRKKKGAGGGDRMLVDDFGEQLARAGFNYHGNEVMYSGVLGSELVAEIYIGVVYYQRLRHMVSDKFQVRSTGPVNQLTRQPVKGRKFGGGIRFGEMERDSLLAHGAAYLLNDRLFHSSDYYVTEVCSLCGSMLSPQLNRNGSNVSADAKALAVVGGAGGGSRRRRIECSICRTGKGVRRVEMPYVFKFLAAELAAMNIRLTLKLGE